MDKIRKVHRTQGKIGSSSLKKLLPMFTFSARCVGERSTADVVEHAVPRHR